jgi:hypothetical protein
MRFRTFNPKQRLKEVQKVAGIRCFAWLPVAHSNGWIWLEHYYKVDEGFTILGDDDVIFYTTGLTKRLYPEEYVKYKHNPLNLKPVDNHTHNVIWDVLAGRNPLTLREWVARYGSGQSLPAGNGDWEEF